jgi:hypothetical protein
MNEPAKSIWTRHHSLPNLTLFVVKLLRVICAIFRPKMLLRYFFCLACVATMIALFYAEEDLRGKYAWESYMRQSKAKGIDLDWRAYVPPPVPDDQNFAMTPPFDGMFDYERTTTNTHYLWRDTNMFSRIEWASLGAGQAPELGGWVQGHPVDLKKWQLYFQRLTSPHPKHRLKQPEQIAGDAILPAKPEEPVHAVLFALSKMDGGLATIRQASSRPQSRYPIHYDELPSAMLVHLGFLGNVSKALQLRAVAELQSESNQQAFADVNLAFYCAESIKSDPFIISQILRCHMIEADLQPVWEGLGAHRWSEGQLKEFERFFSKTDLLSQYDHWIKAELAFTCGWIESLADDPSTFSEMENWPRQIGALEVATDLRILPRGWYYENELSAARYFRESFRPDIVPQTQRVYPGLSQTNSALFDMLPNTAAYSFAFKQVGRVVSPQGFAHTQTELNLALVACALERYRMAHGYFPNTLDALTPGILEKLPHDIINGEPLKYRLTDPGRFILYSVGWNEKDDGGTYPGPKAPSNQGFRNLFNYHPETGDWVWQYPE